MSLLELHAVSKAYGRHLALDSVDFALNTGEIVGAIGPNGAGKTTLLRLAARLLRPTRGQVATSLATFRSVRYFGGERTLPPNVPANQWFRLWTNDIVVTNRPLGLLSRGTRQRLGLEATLAAQDADLLILDEPWEGLDPDASRWLSETLLEKRAAGASALISSHRIHDLADVCDRCVFLVDGRLTPESVVCGSAADRSTQLFEAFDRARGRQ